LCVDHKEHICCQQKIEVHDFTYFYLFIYRLYITIAQTTNRGRIEINCGRLYNTTGERRPSDVVERRPSDVVERRPSDVVFRRIGTIKERNGRFRGVYQHLSVGTFATEELAQTALDKQNRMLMV
jgi:hypothetical protein